MSIWLGRFAKAISFVIAKSPTRARLLLGDLIGFLWFDVFRIRRRVALANLEIAFPEKSDAERLAIARASLRNMGRSLVEYTLFPFFDQRHVSRHIEFQGLQHLESALARGKGVMILSLHLGNGDFAVAALSRSGYKMNLISKLFKAAWLNDLWFGMRAKHGTRFIAPEKSSFDILKSLKRGEVVVFVLDQFMGPPVGVRTRFFGRETGTAMGLAVMAERTQAPVVPSHTYRRADGRNVVVFEEPIGFSSARPESGADERPKLEMIARMTQAYTDKIEEIVRLHPHQWMWIHKRWKQFRD